jgi:hypothetical protein
MPYKDAAKRKAYQKVYHKDHYDKNKEYYKEKAYAHNKLSRKRNRDFVNRYKSFSECVDCGESNPVVFEFDHVHGEKVANIADMVHQSYSLSAIKDEIRKCEVVCANCHRVRTHDRRN